MNSHHTTENKRKYRVLSPDERGEIMIGLRRGESIRSIAFRLNRNPSVISREIKMNSTGDNYYQAYWAQIHSNQRRQKCRQKERISDPIIRQYMQEKLESDWSPEQIAGRIRIDKPGKKISHETIYQYIFKKDRSLVKYLLCGRKTRKKRKNKRTKRTMIQHRTGIEERPKEINDRSEYGHWEADTAVSKQSKVALMVLQERKLGLTILQKIPRCTPEEMKDALIDSLCDFPAKMRQSITFDNGQENRKHYELQSEIGVKTFFCNPYSSWEKGSVENAVGLTRRKWPKKTDYALISDEEIAMLEYQLNTRPRKRLGYLTPMEYTLSVAFTS